MKKIDKLIINSPYKEPHQYWEYLCDTREFVLQSGRRPAGYSEQLQNRMKTFLLPTALNLPGCVTYGKTEEEARQKIMEAIELYLRPSKEKLSDDAKVFEVAV